MSSILPGIAVFLISLISFKNHDNVKKSTVLGFFLGQFFSGVNPSFQKFFLKTAVLPLSRGYQIEALRSPAVMQTAVRLLQNKISKPDYV
ncbi:MAG: hypothetical protein IJK40_06590 [Clostridia bacterium]|nr:hypothetical protein [Clostridia bacterium]